MQLSQQEMSGCGHYPPHSAELRFRRFNMSKTDGSSALGGKLASEYFWKLNLLKKMFAQRLHWSHWSKTMVSLYRGSSATHKLHAVNDSYFSNIKDAETGRGNTERTNQSAAWKAVWRLTWLNYVSSHLSELRHECNESLWNVSKSVVGQFNAR